jgi:hypothetical protein
MVSIAVPFCRLEKDHFWHLVVQPGVAKDKGAQVGSLERLRHLYLGARFDEDLYPLLVMPGSRDRLREAVITAHFPGMLQALLRK